LPAFLFCHFWRDSGKITKKAPNKNNRKKSYNYVFAPWSKTRYGVTTVLHPNPEQWFTRLERCLLNSA
jgi:hypothetical protein